MPKETHRRSGAHEPSVKLRKRKFAVQDNAVEHVKIGDAIEASGTEILESLSASEVRPVRTKKEKLQQKHEAFLQRLDISHSPYSKSHLRRMKRKAKEQIAGGLDDMQAAIASLDEEIPAAVSQSVKDAAASSSAPPSRAHIKPGMIGEGKKAPLSKSQRKRALQTEQVRHPLILSNPDFKANPFQTIRTHAQNTLVMRQIPSNK
ncbi:putative ribosome biogenesis protein SLX9 [Lyophyllum shimeji]|uniref:Ribosome biogenesis protein SLX9 n=1 Tax=Lyophyllum shimeji TaxID=47721 RepID=A0A9P3PIW4_LYOSH|nr:putative ribosome biogenesis protein SLX9 [Lyophyllum shimeji]